MIVLAHTKFGLVRMQGSGVKRGADSAPPQPERVFENPAWIGLITGWTVYAKNINPSVLRIDLGLYIFPCRQSNQLEIVNTYEAV